MIGTKFYKNNINDLEYEQCADWCNENGSAMIVDRGEYFECVSIPMPTIDQLRSVKIEMIKADRDAAEQQPVQTEKGTFDVDDKAIMRINGAITVLRQTDGSIEWTLANDESVMVNADDLEDVIIALAQQSNAVHEKYRQIKNQIISCESVDDLEKIGW